MCWRKVYDWVEGKYRSVLKETLGVCWRKFRSVSEERKSVLEEIQECAEGKFRIILEGS